MNVLYLDGKKLTMFRATQAELALEGECILLEERLKRVCDYRTAEDYCIAAARLELAACTRKRVSQ